MADRRPKDACGGSHRWGAASVRPNGLLLHTCADCGVGVVVQRGEKPDQRWKGVEVRAELCLHCEVRKHYAHGYCERCYKRWRRHGSPNVVKRPPGKLNLQCSLPGCTDKSHAAGEWKGRKARFCLTHYMRYHRYGDPLYTKRHGAVEIQFKDEKRIRKREVLAS